MLASEPLALNCVESLREMSDIDLRTALAVELYDWHDVRISDAGELTASPRKHFITVPAVVPDWPRNLNAATRVEQRVRHLGLWPGYMKCLAAIVGKDDVSMASARQRCEAALAAVRSMTPTIPI